MAGNGYLDFAQEKHLSFVFRAPNQFQVTRLGNFDQYSLNYEQERFEVQLVDGNYQISQLLEQGRLARAAAFTVRNAQWEMQVSHSLPRFNPDIDYISTAILSRRISKNWTLGGAAIQKQFSERGFSYIASGRARFESRFFQINTELAGSHWEGNEDWGGSLEMNARHRNFTMGATALYAGPNFAGFFSNSLIVTGNVNYRLDKLSFGGGINYRNNYLLDDINLDRSILNTNLAFKVGNHELGGFIGYNIFRNTINERDFYATATYRYTMGTPI